MPMAVRHRVPSIFSIYMVDVLCCALGCVILLWQVDHQEAETQTASAEARANALSSARLSIGSLTNELNDLKIALSTSEKDKQRVLVELDVTRGARDVADKLALVRKKELDELREEHAKRVKDLEALQVAHS